MALNDDLSLTSWDKTEDPTVVLDLPFDTPTTLPQPPSSQGPGLELPTSPSGTLSTCSSSDVAYGMSSPPFSAVPPLSALEAPNAALTSTPQQSASGFLGAGLPSTGLSTAFVNSPSDSVLSTIGQEPGLDALSRIIAARCVDPLTLPQAAVQDYNDDDHKQQQPAPKRARAAESQQYDGDALWGSGLTAPSAGGSLPPPPTQRPTLQQSGGLSPYMMLNSMRKKEYAAPPGVWKNSGGYISTVYVNKRRVYGPLRKTLAESVRDREEMLIAKENHASEEEIRELVAALKGINGGGSSRASSKGRKHRKPRKSSKTKTNSTTTTTTTSTTTSSTGSEEGLFPTIPETDAAGPAMELPSLATRFQNENYFGGFSPDAFGFAQY
ncbi:hypothetical protein Pmar_PMAR018063 [Perkinsus marinus ATCC 50983]|uniref:Uncharacterized protein n=1 Tax=Perkinsus marinus (strain ATCC 50983 / TXsc) TaxID=423536 RepID=C5KRW7_PERM5|nr:hypothetical protein Pmar_PMAR018063 [Perkinsus marinus ATCC 50983]EER12808.1 hypothetical protein Pmar_PMAR018063 [Perkinsus marinus ATCC 50983]|eukprot:XP_002781013.1 hypothetical protein Pmar_PMAR018063 [Perkinsus marinus ATCC 50983]